MAYDRQPLAFSVNLCSYYTALQVEKYEQSTIFWPHRTTIECVGQCCFAQELHSVTQNKFGKLYESPIDKQHKCEQNL